MKPAAAAHFDLNLLRILVAVYETRSVTRSAERLSLSQPALSNALARLRKRLDDPLFVRIGNRLQATSLVERIAPGLRDQLIAIDAQLGTRERFDPLSSRRIWRLSLSDLGEAVFMSKLVAAMVKEGPNMGVENLAISQEALGEHLRTAQLDFTIGVHQIGRSGLRSLALFEETYVALAPRSLRATQLTEADLANHRLAIASPSTTHHQRLERALSQLGLDSAIKVRARHFSTMPELVSGAGMVGIVPESFGRMIAPRINAKVIALPDSLPEFQVRMVWPASRSNDPANNWFRQLAQRSLGHARQ